MNFEDLLKILFSTGLLAMGWFSRIIWTATQELKTDLANLRIEIAKDYTPKDDFKMFTSEIRAMFEIIRDKLDNKADK